MWGDNGRQGRQGETRPREGGRTINTGTHVGRQWETRGSKISGRWTQHPTPDIASKQREPNQHTAWGRRSIFYLNCMFFFGNDGPFFLLIFPDKFPVVPHKERAKVSEIGTLWERLLVVNHGWQSESTDGPKGNWSCIFWSGCNGCSSHHPQLLDVL